MKKWFISTLLLIAVDLLHAQDSACFSFVGKVYGEEVRKAPPYDIITKPLIDAHISFKELPKQGWLTDSTRCFRIEDLKNEAFHLKDSYVGLSLFQYKLDFPDPIHSHADVLIIDYSSCDKPVLMRYERLLIAQTNDRYLEVGAPVCYLNERGDTVIPFGKYKFCQTDTIRHIGFAYENRQNGKIVCLDNQGNKLFNVLKYDNGVDYVKEGLFRITDDNGLIGFADTLGNIIIKPQFKFAFPFANGTAKVTDKGEEREVPGSNGEYHYWDSNEWYYIDRRNFVLPVPITVLQDM